jgi:hypothetical protein
VCLTAVLTQNKVCTKSESSETYSYHYSRKFPSESGAVYCRRVVVGPAVV